MSAAGCSRALRDPLATQRHVSLLSHYNTHFTRTLANISHTNPSGLLSTSACSHLAPPQAYAAHWAAGFAGRKSESCTSLAVAYSSSTMNRIVCRTSALPQRQATASRQLSVRVSHRPMFSTVPRKLAAPIAAAGSEQETETSSEPEREIVAPGGRISNPEVIDYHCHMLLLYQLLLQLFQQPPLPLSLQVGPMLPPSSIFPALALPRSSHPFGSLFTRTDPAFGDIPRWLSAIS